MLTTSNKVVQSRVGTSFVVEAASGMVTRLVLIEQNTDASIGPTLYGIVRNGYSKCGKSRLVICVEARFKKNWRPPNQI